MVFDAVYSAKPDWQFETASYKKTSEEKERLMMELLEIF